MLLSPNLCFEGEGTAALNCPEAAFGNSELEHTGSLRQEDPGLGLTVLASG